MLGMGAGEGFPRYPAPAEGGAMAGRFGSVITAMVTPFRDDYALDLDGAQSLAAWLLENGSDGLVVAGSTGEAPTLTHQEKKDLVRAVVEVARGRAEVENIVAVKDSTGDFQTASRIMKESPPDFDLYSGDDWATFPLSCMGGAGIVSVASHLVGDRIREMIELIQTGDVPSARKIHD